MLILSSFIACTLFSIPLAILAAPFEYIFIPTVESIDATTLTRSTQLIVGSHKAHRPLQFDYLVTRQHSAAVGVLCSVRVCRPSKPAKLRTIWFSILLFDVFRAAGPFQFHRAAALFWRWQRWLSACVSLVWWSRIWEVSSTSAEEYFCIYYFGYKNLFLIL